MNRFWKLLHWEITRFGKMYGVLWLVTLLSQFIGIIVFSIQYMNLVNEQMFRGNLSAAEYAVRSGKTGFHYYSQTLWFSAPIALCAAALLLYVFMIWYREWFGKNTFAYRLLMLPISRMSVYLAKLGAILLFVLGLVAFQLLTLPLQILLFNSMIPSQLRESLSTADVILYNDLLRMLAPRHFIEFVLFYTAGLMAVLVIFTAILLERSFRLKGAAAGIVYGFAAGFLFISPILVTENWFQNYFYPGEVVTMEILVGSLIIGVSLWFSSYLLRKKVTV